MPVASDFNTFLLVDKIYKLVIPISNALDDFNIC